MPVIQLPKCKTCGTTENVRKCGECLQYTCYECVAFIDEGCMHKTRHALNKHDWNDPQWMLWGRDAQE